MMILIAIKKELFDIVRIMEVVADSTLNFELQRRLKLEEEFSSWGRTSVFVSDWKPLKYKYLEWDIRQLKNDASIENLGKLDLGLTTTVFQEEWVSLIYICWKRFGLLHKRWIVTHEFLQGSPFFPRHFNHNHQISIRQIVWPTNIKSGDDSFSHFQMHRIHVSVLMKLQKQISWKWFNLLQYAKTKLNE